jgi:hypothetical protein
MSDLGSYIWFIGLGACIVALGIAIAVGRMRRRNTPAIGDPNNAWKEVARDTGHPEVAQPDHRRV